MSSTMRESLCGLLLDNLERLPVVTLVTTRLLQADARGGSSGRNRCAQFVRGVGHELPLLVE